MPSFEHCGYWLTPGRLYGVRARWLRLAVAVSQSAVRHQFERGADQALGMGTRYGLHVRLGRLSWATYVERRESEVLLSPATTELALAAQAGDPPPPPTED